MKSFWSRQGQKKMPMNLWLKATTEYRKTIFSQQNRLGKLFKKITGGGGDVRFTFFSYPKNNS